MKVDNAVILAAGISSRFVPISFEKPKALVEVKGEILIERQIRQLIEAGIKDIYVVTGYKAEQFEYLKEAFQVKLIHNPDYLVRNNNSSIYAARDILENSYICSSDNYFSENPFEAEVDGSYYAARYAEGYTDEWCLQEDENGYISSVSIGGENAWYMLGHAFWSEDFSKAFLSFLLKEYVLEETKKKFWEDIFIEHINDLKMKIRKYDHDIIHEFDSLDELREFDHSYVDDARSLILKEISQSHSVPESEIKEFTPVTDFDGRTIGFEYSCCGERFTHIKQDETTS